MSNYPDLTLALASMFQSAHLIDQLAHGKAVNPAAFDCSVDSLFYLDAESTEDIYGHGDGLIQGLKLIVDYLGGKQRNPQRQMAYYVLSMLKLERRLMKDLQMSDKVQQGLVMIQQQSGDFELSSGARLHKIDGLYQETISQIKPRIMVQGEQVHLANPDTTSRIRSLLFAGIRAAVLWRQRGGSRWKLLFGRKKLVRQAEQLLNRFQPGLE